MGGFAWGTERNPPWAIEVRVANAAGMTTRARLLPRSFCSSIVHVLAAALQVPLTSHPASIHFHSTGDDATNCALCEFRVQDTDRNQGRRSSTGVYNNRGQREEAPASKRTDSQAGSATSPPSGQTIIPDIEGYEVLRPLGSGTYGECFLVKDPSNGDIFAAKV